MTDLEMDITSVENSIECCAYDYRNSTQASQHHRVKWAKLVHRELNWLRENAPDNYLLKQDFSDIPA